MKNFSIINGTNEEIKELDELEKFVEFAVKYNKVEDAIFNIIIVDEEKIQELNREYRNIDRVTDVISFALEDDQTFIDVNCRVLGDIYICFKKALDQSKEYGHSLLREISFLSVHGLLHLLGYDHMKKEDEEVMFDLQERILDAYGIKR